MAFWLYRKEPHSDGSAQYVQERGVVLAGGGLIWEACNAQLKHADVGWTVSGRDLATAAGEDPGCHAVVIDTAPSRPTVSLFEIRSVAGYSYADWTPLMFTLEQLFADDEAPDSVEAMKHQFSDAACPRLFVRDFLYVTGGYATGTWNWGGTPERPPCCSGRTPGRSSRSRPPRRPGGHAHAHAHGSARRTHQPGDKSTTTAFGESEAASPPRRGSPTCYHRLAGYQVILD